MSSTEDYVYKATRLPPFISSAQYPNFYIRNPVLSYVPPIKSGRIELNQHIVANQFSLTHTLFQASYGCDRYLISNLAEKGLCVRMDGFGMASPKGNTLWFTSLQYASKIQ